VPYSLSICRTCSYKTYSVSKFIWWNQI